MSSQKFQGLKNKALTKAVPFYVLISRRVDEVGPEVALLEANGPAPFFGVKTEVFRSTHKTAEPEGRGLFKAVFTDSNPHRYTFAHKYSFLRTDTNLRHTHTRFLPSYRGYIRKQTRFFARFTRVKPHPGPSPQNAPPPVASAGVAGKGAPPTARPFKRLVT